VIDAIGTALRDAARKAGGRVFATRDDGTSKASRADSIIVIATVRIARACASA
jgi:hypothetical protein